MVQTLNFRSGAKLSILAHKEQPFGDFPAESTLLTDLHCQYALSNEYYPMDDHRKRTKKTDGFGFISSSAVLDQVWE